MYECPACDQFHDEPAEARLGMHVLCLDCYYENAEPALPASLQTRPIAA